jgi:cytochrome c
MRKTKMLAAAAAMTFASGFAMADGAALYAAKGCAACHGADGKSPTAPMYPKLAGQSATYALNQMKDIKSGARANGMSMVMKPMVANVSDAELEAIANWLATQ